MLQSYCISAWRRYLNSEQVGKFNALLNRAKKYQLTEDIFDFAGLLMKTEYKLFEKRQSEHYCLYHCPPPVRTGCQALRKRRHYFEVPLCRYEQ